MSSGRRVCCRVEWGGLRGGAAESQSQSRTSSAASRSLPVCAGGFCRAHSRIVRAVVVLSQHIGFRHPLQCEAAPSACLSITQLQLLALHCHANHILQAALRRGAGQLPCPGRVSPMAMAAMMVGCALDGTVRQPSDGEQMGVSPAPLNYP